MVLSECDEMVMNGIKDKPESYSTRIYLYASRWGDRESFVDAFTMPITLSGVSVHMQATRPHG